ncbi:hypothetical protein [Hymenobacter sp. PAMC 26628]|uniref:hypothetical protein n=1 Tax=Hymenobacter sp. PAMC 26628 TaxID=1484118 RepID=UPI000AF7EB7C|nr:hypothetical protein [Hymenobacter sp. PAMC 26628]
MLTTSQRRGRGPKSLRAAAGAPPNVDEHGHLTQQLGLRPAAPGSCSGRWLVFSWL